MLPTFLLQLLNKKTGYQKPVFLLLFILLISAVTPGKSFAQITYTWTGASSTAWNVTGNWTKSSGTSTPGTAATDIVIIPATGTLPTLSTALATSIASLTFTGNSTLTITGQTLTVTGAVTVNSSTAANRTNTITGTGTLVCGSISVGSGGGGTANRTTGLTSTLANVTVSGGITLNSSFSTFRNNSSFTHTSGIVTAASITSVNPNTGNTSTYTLGATSPTLRLTGATPLVRAALGNSTFTFNGTGATVDYQASSNFTFPAVSPTAYTNLIISGGGAAVKTLAVNTTVSANLTVKAGTTLAQSSFTLGTPTSITLETVGGGNGSVISGSAALTLGGTVTVNYTGSGAISTGAVISSPVALGATRTISVADDGLSVIEDLTISGIISGNTFGITKTGTGELALTAANTFTGAVTISAGILSCNTIANANTASSLGTGAGTSAISIAATGTLQYTGSGHSTSRAITLTGSGASIDASGTGTATFSGAVGGNTFGLVLTGTGTGIYSGVIGTTSGTVTKTGAGTWTLSGASTYTGTTTISAGTLMSGAAVAVSTNGPFGNAASAIILGNAATTTNNSSPALLINGAFTMARAVTVANQATSGTYSIGGNTDNNATFSGLITFSQPFSITQVATTGANTLTISGGITGGLAGAKTVTFNNVGAVAQTTTAISDGTGTTAIDKQNTGVLTISVGNTHTGGTTVTAGTLNINNATALGAAGGTFTIAGGVIDNTTAGAITNTANNPIALNGNFTFTGTQNLNLGTGAVTFNADRIVTVGANTLTIGGTVSAGATSLTKAGTGTLSFGSQTVTINSLTISAGIFIATSGTMNIAGNFTNSGTFTHNSGTVIFNGTGAQSIAGVNFNNLTISGNKNAGVITLDNGGTIGVAAVFSVTATNASYTVTGNTFDYNGSGAQTIAPFTYNNLVISNAGIKTIAAATFVTCLTFTINNAATIDVPSTTNSLTITQ